MERLRNEQLIAFWKEGYRSVPRAYVEELTETAIERIERIARGYSRVCVGYSAGKDSIVTEDLVRRAGVPHIPFLWKTQYHHKSFDEWVAENGPAGLRIVPIPMPSWEYLEKHPNMVFPATSKDNTKWMSFKWDVQRDSLTEAGCDLFITGRRVAESNRCGSRASEWVVEGKRYATFSPIADWSTKDVLAYLRYNGISLPPQYFDAPDGFIGGSAVWIELPRYESVRDSVEQMLEDAYRADPEAVKEAGKHLTIVADYLHLRLCRETTKEFMEGKYLGNHKEETG